MKHSDDYTVRLVDLPIESGGMVSMSPDGHYNIYINARMDRATQKKKLSHELKHIENDDFYNDDPIEIVESRASDSLSSIPTLVKARDLKKPSPSGEGGPRSGTDEVASHEPITPRQSRVLFNALSDLDRFLFCEHEEWY